MDPDQFGRPMRLSTEDFPLRDRIAAWCDSIAPSLFKLHIEPVPGENFFASAKMRQLPGITLASMTTSPADYSHEAGSDAAWIDLIVPSHGGLASQARRETGVVAGQACFVDGWENAGFITGPGRRSHCLHFRVPRNSIAWPFERLADAMLKPIRLDVARLHYLRHFSRQLLNDRSTDDPRFVASAAAHLRDLFNVVLGEAAGLQLDPERPDRRAAQLAIIKSYIDSNLADPGLSVASVAANHAMSARTVQRLFENEEDTYSDYVLRRRLEAAYMALSDAHKSHLTVLQVALHCGFGDLSYFHRSFRQRYGEPPSMVRHRNQRRVK